VSSSDQQSAGADCAPQKEVRAAPAQMAATPSTRVEPSDGSSPRLLDARDIIGMWMDDLKAAMRTDGAKPTATMNEAKLEGAPRYEASASTGRDGTPPSPPASPAAPERRTRQK
jgi:hypothetical protein